MEVYIAYIKVAYLRKHVLPIALAFALILGVLKLNQYIFYSYNTSPTVILSPVGIGLAFTYLFGYRMAIASALAWFISIWTSPAGYPWVVPITAAIGYPAQIILGAYLLKRFRFLGNLAMTRCALILIGVALFTPIIGPMLTTSAKVFTGTLQIPFWESLSRAWAGGIFSVMVFTPLITTMFRTPPIQIKRKHWEVAAALGLLITAVYLTFWTDLPRANIFLVLYFLFGSMFWVGLRMSPRIMAQGVALVAFFGMAGSIIAEPTSTPLNEQLFADELFIVLFAPFFYILTALVEERRVNEKMAKQKAVELELINKTLEEADRTKNEFLATLAHELRNPLAPVVSSLELLRMRSEETHNREFIEIIDIAESHNSTLAHLLNDLLDISRITQNKFQLGKETISLKNVIGRSIRTVNGIYKMRRHTLNVLLPEQDIWIEADPVRIEQILVNILTNAAKYTDIGGSIVLKAEVAGGKLKIWVKDNGVGIVPEMLEKIFDPFVQVKYNFNRTAGLGIGLSLTKRLVELHGGRIRAESPGQNLGSIFMVEFPPVMVVNAPPSVPSSSAKMNDREQANKPAAKKILVIDDNKQAAIGLVRILERKGHQVSVAFEGNYALEELRLNRPDVVLLDIGMPGMDGYEVAKQIRKEYRDSPLLIAVTGYGQESDKDKARQSGFDHHLTKPVRIAEIESLLSNKSEPAILAA